MEGMEELYGAQLTHDFDHATVPDMLDAAANNVLWGRDYLREHPVEHALDIGFFFDEALSRIQFSRK
jgi:hypothetical protein